MEQRVAKLEMIVQRLMRRQQKVAKAIVPPVPISGAKSGISVQGEIFTYMFPCEGKIVKGVIRFMDKPRGNIEVRVEVFSDGRAERKVFSIDKALTQADMDMDIKAGDCLMVSILADPEHPVTRVWTSLLFRPSMSEVETKEYLIDELDKVAKL